MCSKLPFHQSCSPSAGKEALNAIVPLGSASHNEGVAAGSQRTAFRPASWVVGASGAGNGHPVGRTDDTHGQTDGCGQ